MTNLTKIYPLYFSKWIKKLILEIQTVKNKLKKDPPKYQKKMVDNITKMK